MKRSTRLEEWLKGTEWEGNSVYLGERVCDDHLSDYTDCSMTAFATDEAAWRQFVLSNGSPEFFKVSVRDSVGNLVFRYCYRNSDVFWCRSKDYALAWMFLSQAVTRVSFELLEEDMETRCLLSL